MKKWFTIVFSILCLGLAIAGARLDILEVKYAFLGLVALSFLLTSLGVFKPKLYPVLIYCISLGLLYQTTLLSDYLIGTDIHGEYLFANLFLSNGYWDPNIPWSYNSALFTTILIPMISYITGIQMEWVFKILPPLLLAGVPVILYYLFLRTFGSQKSILSILFLVSVLTWQLELPGIAKHMVGELFLVWILYLVVWGKNPWRYLLIFFLSLVLLLTHYTQAIILFFYLLGTLVILWGLRNILKREVEIKLKWLGISTGILLTCTILYLTFVSQGVTVQALGIHINTGLSYQAAQLKTIENKTETKPTETKPAENKTVKLDVNSGEIKKAEAKSPLDLSDRDNISKGALGGDWDKTDIWGKIFRILQWMTQIFVILGILVLLWRWKRLKPEYLAVFGSGCILLGAMVFFYWLAPLMNTTRFYHMVLLTISPAFVLGGLLVLRKSWLLSLLLIVYFIFSSGIPFEALKITKLDFINIPYSHALSAGRADTAGVYTNCDAEVRDWSVSNTGSTVIYTDQNGGVFLSEKVGYKIEAFSWFYKMAPDAAYIYLRERNEKTKTITFWTGIGVRLIEDYTKSDLNKILEGRSIIYQCGDSKLYGPKK